MTLLPKNVHKIERVFRFLFGLFLLSLIFWGPETWWGLLGLIPLLTSLVGSCPLYTITGISTCKHCDTGARTGDLPGGA